MSNTLELPRGVSFVAILFMAYLVGSSRIPLQLHSYYERILDPNLLCMLHLVSSIYCAHATQYKSSGCLGTCYIQHQENLHTVDQNYAVSVEYGHKDANVS